MNLTFLDMTHVCFSPLPVLPICPIPPSPPPSEGGGGAQVSLVLHTPDSLACNSNDINKVNYWRMT